MTCQDLQEPDTFIQALKSVEPQTSFPICFSERNQIRYSLRRCYTTNMDSSAVL